MYTLTINGITKEFETAAEMAAWQEAMSKPKRIKRPKKQKRTIVSDLSKYINKDSK